MIDLVESAPNQPQSRKGLNACFRRAFHAGPQPHTQPPPSKTRSPLLHLATPPGSLTCQLPIRIAAIALQINDLDGTLVRQAGPVHGAITPFLPLKIMHGCIRARVMFVWAASSVAMLKEARLLLSALPAILLLNLMFLQSSPDRTMSRLSHCSWIRDGR
jgi:hypothetical protein